MNTIVRYLSRWYDRLRRAAPPTPDDQLGHILEGMIDSKQFTAENGLAMLLVDVQRQRAHERRIQDNEQKWKRLRRMTLVTMALAGVIGSTSLYLYRNGLKLPSSNPVSVVTIVGEVGMARSGQAEFVIPALRRAFENADSKAVVLRINSPGGLPVDAERITTELKLLRKKHPQKAVVAVIETVGASAAYMVAVHADEIYAGKYSMVGSVGAIVSAWNVGGLSERLAVKKDSYASGKFKALLDPFKEPNPEERQKVLSLVNELGSTFAQEVVASRKDRLKISQEALATGEVWTGTEALRLGLIDKIGTLETVADKYDATPRDYGPFTDARESMDSVVTRFGAAFFEGLRQAAVASATVLPR